MKKKINSYLIILLLLAAPFVQSDTSEIVQKELLNSVPPLFSVFANYLRWFIYALVILLVLIRIRVIIRYFNWVSKYMVCFYLVPLVYALASFTDVPRYLGLVIVTACLPLFISCELSTRNFSFLLKSIQKVILFTFLVSVFVSYKTIMVGFRFQGVLGNANMYGITGTFWIAILLIQNKEIKLSKGNVVLAALIFISVILTGSRSAVVASSLILFFSFLNNFKGLFFISSLLMLILLVLTTFVDINFIISRFDNISESAKESGRTEIWDAAFTYIDLNKFGYGMNASTDLLGTGNTHNCYIRYMLSMGIFYTVVSLFFYFLLILKLLIQKKTYIPKSLIAFIIAFALANYAEDFFVGIGSSMFVYLSLAIGLISHFYIRSKQIALEENELALT